MEELTPIQRFYKDQTIFITGGTGFIGKVLIEKLLRTCPDIKTIYIMVRVKKGKTADQRFSEIFNTPCFDTLKLQMPNFVEKLRLISGDCEEPGLGLSLQDREILKKDTTVVIHAAANVRFDQELRLATKTNIKSVEAILQLTKEMGKLKALVHVSTAYANCHQKFIDEKFYEPGIKAKDLYALLEDIDEDTLDTITPELIKKWPNTYTYTKCIAEDLIKSEAKDLPVTIVRPGIIISSVKEPMPGWAENFYGLIGMAVGFMIGVIRVFNGTKNNTMHFVPCDFVVNNIIASAWHLQDRNKLIGNNKLSNEKSQRENNEPLIYNYIGSKENFLTAGDFIAMLNKNKWIFPSNFMIWFPSVTIIESTLWSDIRIFFQHTLVSYIIDLILICLGKKPITVQKYKQVNKYLKLTSPFSLNTWHFEYGNVEKLAKKMSQRDREIFQVSMDDFDTDKYLDDSVYYGRIYLLKESVESIPAARKKIKVLFVVHYAFIILMWYLFLKILFNIIFLFFFN